MASLHTFHPKRWGTAVCLLALLALPAAAAAQTGSITGQARDRTTGEPLNGVQVSVEGTNIGGLTDARGRYLIQNVPAGPQTLNAVYIGYRTEQATVTVAAGGTAEANFDMGVSAVTLEEVVVTGTGGAVERKELGATVASVSVAAVQEKVPVSDVSSVLQARVPGVRSIGTVGGVGASRDLRIRGTSSFELGQRPVVYIDGIKVDTRQEEWSGMGTSCCSYSGGAGTDRLNDLNPNDIERIEVIKGAAAGTLYGSEATNGVIQIFTKKGRSDSAPRWSAQLTTGMQRYRENIQTKQWPRFSGPDGTQALDANKTLIENGPYFGADLTVQGGGSSMTYFVSGGYTNEQGSIQPNGMQRGNLRLNMHWLATQKLSFDVTSAYTRNRLVELQSGNNWTSMLGNAVLGVPYQACTTGCVDEFARPYGEPWVPIVAIKEIDTFDDASRWTGGVTANLNIADNFTHRLQFGLDAVNQERTFLRPFGYPYTYVPAGEKSLGYRNFRSVTMDYLGSLSFDQFVPNFSTRLSFGAQGFQTTERFNTAVGRDYAAPGVTTVRGGAVRGGDELYEEVVQLGIFGQNRLSYADKLFLTTGVRVDGNSAFGDDYGFQVYPNVQLSYDLMQEGILPEIFSNLRLRGALGTAGLAPGAFDKFLTFTPFTTGEEESGVRADESGNAELGPERTTEVELGFEAGFLNDRIGLDFTAYRRVTKDAIAEVALAPSLQFGDDPLQNIGEIQDRGYELALRVTPIESSALRWSTDLRLDGNHNEITDLGTDADTAVLRRGNLRLGQPVTTYYTRRICTPEMSAMAEDDPRSGGCSGKTGYNPATRQFTRTDTTVFIGRTLPNFNLSLGNELTFGSFRLYGLVTMERGAWFSNGDRPYRANFRSGDEYLSLIAAAGSADCVTSWPTGAQGVRYVDAAQQWCETVASDSLYNLFRSVGAPERRDNVRLRELSLTYMIPEAFTTRIGLGRSQFTIAGQNLQWWDDCHCMDPNMNYQGGNDFSVQNGFLAQPQARMVKLSIRTTF
jgi:TonB-dependent SusC/RagA subfamily outer membrane receptor